MNFNRLKNLSFNIFNKEESLKKEKEEKQNQYKKFIEKFNRFLELDDYLFCIKLLDSGLVLSEVKNNEFNDYVKDAIFNEKINYFQIKDCINVSVLNRAIAFIALNDKNDSYSEDVNFFCNTIKGKNNNNLVDYIIQKVINFKNYFPYRENLNENFIKLLKFNNQMIVNNMFDIKDVKRIKEVLEQLKERIDVVTKDVTTKGSFNSSKSELCFHTIDYVEIQKQTEIVKEYFLNYLQNNETIKNEKENILAELKSFTFNDKKIVVSNEYSIKDLPLKTQSLINDANGIIKRLNTREDFESFNENVNTVVKKFLSIDPEYRTTLKNVQGFNAEELMNSSLNDLKELFVKKLDDKNQEKITELSVESRKFKMI